MRFHSTRSRALGLALVALGAAMLGSGCDKNGDANPAGSLETPTLDLAPLVTGRVLRVGAQEGQHVDAGDTLLVVDTDLLRLKRGGNTKVDVYFEDRKARGYTFMAQRLYLASFLTYAGSMTVKAKAAY